MPQASTVYSLLLSEVMISLNYEQHKHILIPLLSHPKLTAEDKVLHPTSLPSTTCVPPRLPPCLSIWQRSQFYPTCCNSQSLSHTKYCNQVKFVLIKMFSSLHACTGKLEDDI